jgi:hypothetical protein
MYTDYLLWYPLFTDHMSSHVPESVIGKREVKSDVKPSVIQVLATGTILKARSLPFGQD